jgi:hypothetical protein
MGAIAYVAQRRLCGGARRSWPAPLAIRASSSPSASSRRTRAPVLLRTIWIIFVAADKYLPIAYTACHAAIQTVHVDLEDAARILGANRLVAFKV